MKRIRNISAILLCAAMLCACGTQAQHKETEITSTDVTETTSITTQMTEPTETTSATTETTVTTTAYRGDDIPVPINYEYGEMDGYKYVYYQFILIGLHSEDEHVEMQIIHKKIHFREGNLFAGILKSEVSQLPNCRELVFPEGTESIQWNDKYVHAPHLEILHFPSTMTRLDITRDSNELPLPDGFVESVRIPYDPEMVGLGDWYKLGERESEKSFYNSQELAIRYGIFRDRENLTHIEVAEGNPTYYDVDGVLYAKGLWGDAYYYLPYAPGLTELPTVNMYCLPQNHPAVDGVYTITDGTQYIHSGAIYHPRNIDRLVLPDSLLYLSPTAIIATAEHPLTIVCSRNSVAAEYVERFGSLYHLTVEYTD